MSPFTTPPPSDEQVPDLTIWYGPDTYMGENLHNMLIELAEMTDEQIKEVHPGHDQVLLRAVGAGGRGRGSPGYALFWPIPVSVMMPWSTAAWLVRAACWARWLGR